jgi:hypothetical protein
MSLSDSQVSVLQAMKMSKEHFLLCGVAKSGKSRLVQEYAKQCTGIGLTALTTGGALTLKAHTLYAFFGLRVVDEKDTLESLWEKMKYMTPVVDRLREINTLVIDDVSRLSKWDFELIEGLLRFARGKDSVLFGGVRLILVGDLFQLPPIVCNFRQEQGSGSVYSLVGDSYFFKSDLWRQLRFDAVYMSDCLLTDAVFRRVLRGLGEGLLSQESIDALISRQVNLTGKFTPFFGKEDEMDGKIIICTSTHRREEINKLMIDSGKSKLRPYPAMDRGNIGLLCEDDRQSLFRYPEVIELKVGARIRILTTTDLTSVARTSGMSSLPSPANTQALATLQNRSL